MFDIGFTELLLLGVVALIVLGPERLPHAARMTGAWIGKIRRTFLSLQVEIEREVNASEIRERIKQEAEKAGLSDIQNQLNETVKDAEELGKQLHESVDQVGGEKFRQHLESELEKSNSVEHKKNIAEAPNLNNTSTTNISTTNISTTNTSTTNTSTANTTPEAIDSKNSDSKNSGSEKSNAD